ncbi:MerR family transcriptional regulator [Paenibacillus dendritiformis]|uniref:MerR family transcriptional regulator n=1 Tax=Paenibacillus dendritiformis TaxID=130049 RepID=UPI0020C31036|nr:MerR family transcriptional regulator [Paenibacillus dendritiformis]CAH8771063.1 MerR family transcriptional regulator [Paenibacillus dendritiformis]
MFKISEFSKLSQVPAKTLRYYDQLGLLRPACKDSQSGYRYYTSEQLLRLQRIFALKDLGFTLEQIKQILHDEVSAADIRRMLLLKQAEVESLIQSETERLLRIEARLKQLEQEGDKLPRHEVLVKKLEPTMVVSIREATNRVRIPGLLAEIDEYLQWNGLPAASRHIVVWHSYAEGENGVELAVACPVPRLLPDTDRFTTMTLPGMTAASVTHMSRPGTESNVCIDLGAWIERNGYRISPELPSREVYASRQEGDGRMYVTDTQMPIMEVDAIC